MEEARVSEARRGDAAVSRLGEGQGQEAQGGGFAPAPPEGQRQIAGGQERAAADEERGERPDETVGATGGEDVDCTPSVPPSARHQEAARDERFSPSGLSFVQAGHGERGHSSHLVQLPDCALRCLLCHEVVTGVYKLILRWLLCKPTGEHHYCRKREKQCRKGMNQSVGGEVDRT